MEIDTNIAENSVVEDDVVVAYEASRNKFKDDNEWYGSNRAMTALADKIGTEYATNYEKKNGFLPDPDDFFDYVLEEVKKDFPDKEERPKVNKVNSGNRVVTQTKKTKKKTLADLPEDQRAIAQEVIAATGLSEDEYLKNYEF